MTNPAQYSRTVTVTYKDIEYRLKAYISELTHVHANFPTWDIDLKPSPSPLKVFTVTLTDHQVSVGTWQLFDKKIIEDYPEELQPMAALFFTWADNHKRAGTRTQLSVLPHYGKFSFNNSTLLHALGVHTIKGYAFGEGKEFLYEPLPKEIVGMVDRALDLIDGRRF